MSARSRLLQTAAVVALAACSSSQPDGGWGSDSGPAPQSSSSGSGTSSGGSGSASSSSGGGSSSGSSGASSGSTSTSSSSGSGSGASSSTSGSGSGSGGTSSSSGGTSSSSGGRSSSSSSGSGSASSSSGSGTGSSASSSGANSGSDGGTCGAAAVPSGGTQHCSVTGQGVAGSLSWSLWSNGSGGCITTYPTNAYSASWSNTGDFLARAGLDFNQTPYTSLGTVTAQFDETKTGTAGGFSYIAIYGWSVSPCIEWYIVDDSFNKMPVNPGQTTNKGTATIDGGTYTLYTRPTSGTGGSRCPGVSSWTQFYSVRQTARTCGQISISQHWQAWANAGMTLGSMLESKILIETGGGTGSINFTTASVTAQ